MLVPQGALALGEGRPAWVPHGQLGQGTLNPDKLAPGVALLPWTTDALPAGVAEGVVATLPDGSRYELGFDAHALLVWARGPLDLRPIVKGDVTARFDDFRRAGGLLVPFRTSYAVGERALAEERALAVCVDPPGLGPDAFTAPDRLPACP